MGSMSVATLLSLLSLLLLWGIYRISRFAVAPLLADRRAARARREHVLPLPAATSVPDDARSLLQALAVGGAALLIYSLNLVLYEPDLLLGTLIAFPLSASYDYQYGPLSNLGTTASLASGLLVFARIGQGKALMAFAVLIMAGFLYSLAFNIIGAMNYGDRSGFFASIPYIGIFYKAGYAAMLAFVLRHFSPAFRQIRPWLAMLGAGAVGEYIGNWVLVYFYDSSLWMYSFHFARAIPEIVIVAAAGWWMKPSAAS